MRALTTICPILLLFATALPLAGQQVHADHVILITLDGVRHQDLFGGADSVLLASPKSASISDTLKFRERWWRTTAEARRRVVMPFFWDSLVPLGALYGASASRPVLSTNGLKFSAPGYMEIFTGKPQADVTSNADRRYPHRTIFDVVAATPPAGQRPVRTDVAAFVSWDVQGRLVSADSTVGVVSASIEPLPPEARPGNGALLERLQSRIGYPVDGMRYDAITHTLALEYLLRFHPRLLHIGLGETDEEAHHGQYERLLGALRVVDEELRELWRAINADPELRGRTAIIITTDHGRGSTPSDWSDHGKGVDGADRIWLFAVGAGIPARGLTSDRTVTQGTAAVTALELLGINPATLGDGIAPSLLGSALPGRTVP